MNKIVLIVMIFSSLSYAAAESLGGVIGWYHQVADAIVKDDIEAFENCFQEPKSLDGPVGTMLLNIACSAPRSHRESTNDFISTLISNGAQFNDAHKVLIRQMHVREQQNIVHMQGTTGYETVHLPLETAIWTGNVKAVAALCRHPVDLEKTSKSLLSWPVYLGRLLLLDFETPREHADAYLHAIEFGDRTVYNGPASEDEMFEITQILHAKENNNGVAAAICPIQ